MRLTITLAVIAAWCGAALAQSPAKERMVVVISLDGFPVFALDDARLPAPTRRT